MLSSPSVPWAVAGDARVLELAVGLELLDRGVEALRC